MPAKKDTRSIHSVFNAPKALPCVIIPNKKANG
jgi:hypothetical protein